jgi:DNA-binding response OmpR family regulator
MTTDLGPTLLSRGASDRRPHQLAVRTHAGRWNETTGTRLLVVDGRGEREQLRDDLAARGVHVTWAGSTLDGLIEFGRTEPNAVIIAPDAPGLPATEFVSKIREYDAPFVIAALDGADAAEAGPLMLAGAGAAVIHPYTADTVWEVLQQASHALDGHARVTFGPIELDARAYAVRVKGERIADLPLKEFEVLRTLMYRAPEVLSDGELRAAVWGARAEGPPANTIAVHVGRLRNRLQGVARIRRIRGRGYSLTLA